MYPLQLEVRSLRLLAATALTLFYKALHQNSYVVYVYSMKLLYLIGCCITLFLLRVN